MADKMTREEIAAKVEWEGGLGETINGYGLNSSVLPDDCPENVRNAWMNVEAINVDLDVINNWLDGEDD